MLYQLSYVPALGRAGVAQQDVRRIVAGGNEVRAHRLACIHDRVDGGGQGAAVVRFVEDAGRAFRRCGGGLWVGHGRALRWHRGEGGGRFWTRTRDLCLIRAVL